MRTYSYTYVLYLCAGIFSGVVVYTSGALSAFPWSVWAIVCLILLLSVFFVLPLDIGVCIVCGLGVGMGIGMMHTPRTFSTEEIRAARVVHHIERTTYGQSFVVEGGAGERVQVFAPRFPEVFIHDELILSCRPERPQSTLFAYEQYLWSKHVIAVCTVRDMYISAHGSTIQHDMSVYEWRFFDVVTAALHEPARSVVASVFLGKDLYLSDDLTEGFRRAGMTHVLVVSGMQLWIIASALSWIGIRVGIPVNARYILVGVMMTMYAYGVGMEASVLRAVIMMSVGFVIHRLGRIRGNRLRILIYAATVMVVVSPYRAVYDVGFQLSFLAVYGLWCVAPWCIDRVACAWPSLRPLAIVTAPSLGAWIATAPCIAWHFHTVSLLGIVTNIVLGWLWSIATIIASVYGISSVVAPWFVSVCVPAVELFFQISVSAVMIFSHFPYGVYTW